MLLPLQRNLTLIRLLLGLLLATFLSYRGYKKQSLDSSGAVAAFLVGFLTFSSSIRLGIIMIVFYQSSSILTKIKADYKARLESDFREGGQRDYFQVLACSFVGTFIALAYNLMDVQDYNNRSPGGGGTFFSNFFTNNIEHQSSKGEEEIRDDLTIDAFLDPSVDAIRTFLLWAYIGHYACANGDTWSSELGILSKGNPRLITSFLTRTVPRGTNGGISAFGTLASILGGATIGLTFGVCGWSMVKLTAFTTTANETEDEELEYFGNIRKDELVQHFTFLILLGGICGLVGSIIDSILGAIFQASYYNPEKKMIMKTKPTPRELSDGSVEIICGHDILSNEMVNIVSIILTTVFAPFCGYHLHQSMFYKA